MQVELKQNKVLLPNSVYVWKAEELNQIIQEIQNVITSGQLQPQSTDVTQLNQAIDYLISQGNSATLIAAQQYTNQQIEEALTGAIHFTGYVSTSTPVDPALRVGSKWITASAMPTTFPVTGVKKWDGTNWVADSNYTPDIFDLWSLMTDGSGWYWFGDEWNRMDFDINLADYQTRSEKNQSNGYAGLDANGKLLQSLLPDTGENIISVFQSSQNIDGIINNTTELSFSVVSSPTTTTIDFTKTVGSIIFDQRGVGGVITLYDLDESILTVKTVVAPTISIDTRTTLPISDEGSNFF
ncbi:MAG: hypothetical protein LBD17_04175 [Endomicrobium sp.]|jgi:hypothetical protein|nr:hypothetical protein [Endomicrobium sp.]